MKKILILISFITIGCNNVSKNSSFGVSSIKIPIDITNLRVINTISRPEQKETILLLADSTYIKEYYKSNTDKQINRKGTVLVLYWNEINDPVWIGAKIHGEYLYADILVFNDSNVNIKRYNEKGSIVNLEKEDLDNSIEITKPPLIYMP
jgi:hypothetical protein